MPVLAQPPDLKIDGQAVAAATTQQIVDLRVEHLASVPSSLTIRFADPHFDLVDATTFGIGKAIAASFPDVNNTLVQVFAGEVVSLGVEQRADRVDSCELVVTAYDHGHRLGRASNVRVFQKQKYSGVVSAIASGHGLSADVADTVVVHEYLVQSTTDYEFLNDIAFRLGCEWWVSGTTLHFGKRADSTPIDVVYGEDVRRLKVRFTASERTTSMKVRGWDPINKVAIVGTDTSVKTPDAAHGGTATLASGGRTAANANGAARILHTFPVASADEAGAIATGLGARAASSELSMRAETIGSPAIKVGSIVNIKQAGTRLSGEYYVTSVEHLFGRNGDYITRFGTGGTEPASLVDLIGGQPSKIASFGQAGLCVGVVTNNKDPNGLGRVRVKLPALSDDIESDWARVVTVGASAGTGVVVLPKLDDEVLVGFEQGDLRRPFVLGGLWNSKSKPPVGTDVLLENGKVVQWSVVTGGHSLVLRGANADTDKHLKLLLSDGKTILYVGTDKTEVISNAKPIEIKNGKASILLAANGDVTIKGTNVNIEATQNVDVKGVGITSKASAASKTEGATLELKASATAKLEAGAVCELKGSLMKIN